MYNIYIFENTNNRNAEYKAFHRKLSHSIEGVIFTYI